MSIEVIVKNVYGKQTIYPACETAKLFAKLVGRKTLNVGDVKTIKDLGYQVNVIPERLTL